MIGYHRNSKLTQLFQAVYNSLSLAFWLQNSLCQSHRLFLAWSFHVIFCTKIQHFDWNQLNRSGSLTGFEILCGFPWKQSCYFILDLVINVLLVSVIYSNKFLTCRILGKKGSKWPKFLDFGGNKSKWKSEGHTIFTCKAHVLQNCCCQAMTRNALTQSNCRILWAATSPGLIDGSS